MYTLNVDTWTSKNPISSSDSIRAFSLSLDWNILAYIDDKNQVYISKYDSATDVYTNPVKIILLSGINSNYNIKLSNDGKLLLLYNAKLYIYRYNEGLDIYEYLQEFIYLG